MAGSDYPMDTKFLTLSSFDLVGEKVMEIAEDAKAELAAQAREEDEEED